jgi:hypothetical protein
MRFEVIWVLRVFVAGLMLGCLVALRIG